MIFYGQVVSLKLESGVNIKHLSSCMETARHVHLLIMSIFMHPDFAFFGRGREQE